MWQEVVQTFGSRMKALEILALLHDVKKIVRQGFYERELTAVEMFCKAHHLFVEKSRNKVVIDDTGLFTNKGKVVAPDEKGMYLLYISKDELKAAQACLFETRCDHFNAGLMFGYPPCCVRFFCEQFSKGNLNPVHVPTNQWTNLTLREKDACLLSHFPCSSECEKSIGIAKRNFEILRRVHEETARLFFDRLQQQDCKHAEEHD